MIYKGIKACIDGYDNILTFYALCSVIWSYKINQRKTCKFEQLKKKEKKVTKFKMYLLTSSSSFPLSLSLLVALSALGSFSLVCQQQFS